MVLYVNGQASSEITPLDRGLAYGDGLFETIALVGKQVQLWPAHHQRLQQGLLRLGIHTDYATLYQQLCHDVTQALQQWHHDRGVLKITLTRGQGGRGYLPPIEPCLTRIVHISAWPKGRDKVSIEGASLHLCQHPWSHNTALAGLKHLNRLDQVLARQEWHDDGLHEGLMLNQRGQVQSGVMSNVFVQHQAQLYTPCHASAGIDGIMAKQVVQLAKRLGIKVYQQALDLDFVLASEGLFLTNSLNGIWPVVSLAAQSFPITRLTRDLQSVLVGHLEAHTELLTC
ncbi:MAG: aminodeoxychorismate lyase [Gammaproteobacteria bacterium]|jgi:4-amino-4-deoxychorismate lyase|nr:aminodeoxychorismate lyase [Gammaproteobacteria bacterium]